MKTLFDLYYGMWAQLALLPFFPRATCVITVCFLLFWPLIAILLPKLVGLACWLLNQLIKASYWLVSTILSVFISHGAFSLREPTDKIAFRAENISIKLQEWFHTWKTKKRKLHLKRAILSYFLVLLLIWLPALLQNKIDPAYLSHFSFVTDLYARLERAPLEKAVGYRPLFVAPPQTAQESPSNKTDENSKTEETPELSLSEIGRQGANLRAGPGPSYTLLLILTEDDTVILLPGEDGRPVEQGEWLHVSVETDITVEGWIHSSMLDLPEDESI